MFYAQPRRPEICGPGKWDRWPTSPTIERVVDISLSGSTAKGTCPESRKNDPLHQAICKVGAKANRRGWPSPATTPPKPAAGQPHGYASFPEGSIARLGPYPPTRDGSPAASAAPPACPAPPDGADEPPSPTLFPPPTFIRRSHRHRRPGGPCVRQHVVGRGLTCLRLGARVPSSAPLGVRPGPGRRPSKPRTPTGPRPGPPRRSSPSLSAATPHTPIPRAGPGDPETPTRETPLNVRWDF